MKSWVSINYFMPCLVCKSKSHCLSISLYPSVCLSEIFHAYFNVCYKTIFSGVMSIMKEIPTRSCHIEMGMDTKNTEAFQMIRIGSQIILFPLPNIIKTRTHMSGSRHVDSMPPRGRQIELPIIGTKCLRKHIIKMDALLTIRCIWIIQN